jgi:hypothetical protein
VSTTSAARNTGKVSIRRTMGNAGGGGECGGGAAERGRGDEVRVGGARVDGPGLAHRPAPPAGTSCASCQSPAAPPARTSGGSSGWAGLAVVHEKA